MASQNFNCSTKEVLLHLGLGNCKSLFRRRIDYKDAQARTLTRFLEPGVHYRRKTPGSTQLVWDLDATVAAWEAALKIAAKQKKTT